MAKLNGPFGRVSIYIDKNGKLRVRKLPDNTGNSKKEPCSPFKLGNRAAFGLACRSALLVRKTFYPWVHRMEDKTGYPRLMKAFMATIKGGGPADRLHPTVAEGALEQLEGYDFNLECPLNDLFKPNYLAANVGADGQVVFESGDYRACMAPRRMPVQFTHFKVVLMAVGFDFENGRYEWIKEESRLMKLVWGKVDPVRVRMEFGLSALPVTVLLEGIEFWEEGKDGRMEKAEEGGKDMLRVFSCVRG